MRPRRLSLPVRLVVTLVSLAALAVGGAAFAPSARSLGEADARGVVAIEATRSSAVTTSAPTLPERMRVLPKRCEQLVVCVGRRPGSTSGTLFLFEKRGNRWVQLFNARTRYGSNGLADGMNRVAGGRTTPTGIWRMGTFAFGHHPAATPGSSVPWRAITRLSWWSSVRDATYNTWVRSTGHVAGEHLSGIGMQYEYAISSGYNAPPNKVVFGRGTAIFLHCFGPRGVLTAGCVAVDRADMIRLLTMLDPAKGPCMVVGTEQGGTPQSVLAY